MYSINDLHTFVAVARGGGVTNGSRQLGISPATASHRISKLEHALKVSLFHRDNRSMLLTDEGHRFLARIENILKDLSDAETEVGSGTLHVRGHLRVTLSPWILSGFILPRLAEFQERHPQLTLEFLSVDRYVSLVQEAQDCAIRVGQLADSSLIARKLADNDRIICAAPSFLAKHGTPNTVEDLKSARWVCLPWQTTFDLHGADGQKFPVTLDRNIAVSNSDMLTRVAIQGLGLSVKSRLAVAKELDNGRLVEVMPGSLYSANAPIWIVFASESRVGRKTRAFAELAAEAFSVVSG